MTQLKRQTVRKYIKKALKFLNEKNWAAGEMIRGKDAKDCKFCVSGAAAYLYLKANKKKISTENISNFGWNFAYTFKDLTHESLIFLNDSAQSFSQMKENVSKGLKALNKGN